MAIKGIGVQELEIKRINFNKDNPREIFDQDEEDKLYFSVKRRGVLVPILVSKDNGEFTLIDGERRLRAAKRAGLAKIPANVIDKETPLEYAIKMFHIHNLRIGWRLMATALELERFKKESKVTKEKELAALTGLSTAKVTHCNKLLAYPPPIRDIILEQEALPKSERRRIGKEKILSDNFFIEFSSGLNIFEKFEPKIFKEYGKDKLIKIFINKRKKGHLDNVTLFREFKRIVRLQNEKSRSIIKKILTKEDYTIDTGYKESGLQTEFLEKKFYQQSSLFLENLGNLELKKNSTRIRNILKEIKGKIEETLGKK